MNFLKTTWNLLKSSDVEDSDNLSVESDVTYEGYDSELEDLDDAFEDDNDEVMMTCLSHSRTARTQAKQKAAIAFQVLLPVA